MKALVAIQNFENRNIGDIVLTTPEDYVGYLLSNGHCVSVDFSNDIEFPAAQYVEEVPATAAYWSKEGETNLGYCPQINDDTWIYHAAEGESPEYWSKEGFEHTYIQPLVNDPTWTYHEYVNAIPAHYEIVEDVDKLKAKQISDLHTQMNKDVLDQMVVVFGTTNPESATAYKQTYDLMLAKPALWVGKLGLVDEAAVTAYATAKIEAIEQYAVWRMERITQFKTERDAILGA